MLQIPTENMIDFCNVIDNLVKFMNNTIAAVSTPRAPGGISVIRISGEKAFEIADNIFTPLSTSKKPSEMEGYTCAYGFYSDREGSRIDHGILSVFRSPRSYTGENVAELSCHGGVFVTQRLLTEIYALGAYPAGPGEFTKRAFISGKMSLTQAESVMDIISAEGEAARRSAEEMLDGALFKSIKKQSDRLLSILGEIAAWVDYPEEDIAAVSEDVLKNDLTEIRTALCRLSETYDTGKILREGIDTVIAGKPNVGKSTLMNLLSGCERSIVTDIAGTTRDIVEESVRLGDIVLRISDTAGIHSTEDIIEGIGVEKAENKIRSASLVLAVFDGSVPLDEDDRRLIEICRNKKNVIAILNKSDKDMLIDKSLISSAFEKIIIVSAKNGQGREEIEDILMKMFISGNICDGITVNDRQKKCIDESVGCIDEALSALEIGDTLDGINILLDEAEAHLLELTGERVSEEVVSQVFSKFCVGK